MKRLGVIDGQDETAEDTVSRPDSVSAHSIFTSESKRDDEEAKLKAEELVMKQETTVGVFKSCTEMPSLLGTDQDEMRFNEKRKASHNFI